jgi:hypothetical protein
VWKVTRQAGEIDPEFGVVCIRVANAARRASRRVAQVSFLTKPSHPRNPSPPFPIFSMPEAAGRSCLIYPVDIPQMR